MDSLEREQIIEESGITTADNVQELQRKVDEIYDFMKVVRVAQTKGFKLEPDPEKQFCVSPDRFQ